jgi:hypothetical protein
MDLGACTVANTENPIDIFAETAHQICAHGMMGFRVKIRWQANAGI